MVSDKDYIELNRNFWNVNTPFHVNSTFYDNESFVAGRSSLFKIDLDLLPDLQDLSLLHLQCHFGQDTLSLARLGAQVTGVDFSEEAIKSARQLATTVNVDARFIQSDVLKLDDHLKEQFDVLYSSYGTIGWLPDIDRWAEIVFQFLKPGGRFYFIEFHPFVWMYDYDFSTLRHSYFNVDVIAEEVKGSYAAPDAQHRNNIMTWNHSLSDVIQGLLNTGLKLINFQEYDYSPANIFDDSIESEHGYQIKGLEGKLPLVYSLVLER